LGYRLDRDRSRIEALKQSDADFGRLIDNLLANFR
jgi:hypothetical protein